MNISVAIPKATDAEIKDVEKELGLTLPNDYKSALKAGGQIDGKAGETSDGQEFMTIKQVLKSWKFMKTLLDGGDFDDRVGKSEKGIASVWFDPHWVPITHNGGGDYYCLDMSPAAGGHSGQVIRWFHDSPERELVAKSFTEWTKSWDTASTEGYQDAPKLNNKLAYRLGLENLEEPEVTHPVIELPGSQLELEQLHHEVADAVKQVDVLQGDTETLEDVKTSLEEALKRGSVSREALQFAAKAIQMVDRRWGYDYPAVSMESSDDELVASMESGLGQRLKNMGHALMEMLKKLWAKLKEWWGKLLQFLGLRKKQLVEIEEHADLIRDIKKYQADQVAKMQAAVIQSKQEFEAHNKEHGLDDETFDREFEQMGKAPLPVSDEAARMAADKEFQALKEKAAAEHAERMAEAKVRQAAKRASVEPFNPRINARVFAHLFQVGSKFPIGKSDFAKDINTMVIFSMNSGIINDVAEEALHVLRDVKSLTVGDVEKIKSKMSEVYSSLFTAKNLWSGVLGLPETGGGNFRSYIDSDVADSKHWYPKAIVCESVGQNLASFEKAAADLDYSNINLFPSDVKEVAKTLRTALDKAEFELEHDKINFERQSKELAVICGRLLDAEAYDNRYGGQCEALLRHFVYNYSNCFISTQAYSKDYLTRYSNALTKHLDLSLEYWEYVKKLEAATQ